jgi:hypothetical protein
MTNSNNSARNTARNTAGFSGVGVVQIVFLILKLCKIAPIGKWPWWKVMLPTECIVGLFCCLGCCVGGCGIISLCLSEDKNVAKPGIVLTEDQLRMFENSIDMRALQPVKRNNDSVDSQATTSPSKHFTKESPKQENIDSIIEEPSDTNV